VTGLVNQGLRLDDFYVSGKWAGDFVEIVVLPTNEEGQEETPWLLFSPLGCSARHFCTLGRARKFGPWITVLLRR
jgi:hypothetical protein